MNVMFLIGNVGRDPEIRTTTGGSKVATFSIATTERWKDKDGERVLPIWVGIFEANAIALQIENIVTPRPMTHDLLRNIITDLDGQVDRVVVSDLKENTFYALIYLMVGGELVAVDARPSDAIALALRARAPIFVEDVVIDNAKTLEFTPEKGDSDRLQKWLESLDPEELGKYKM